MTIIYTRFNDKHLFRANFKLSKDKVSGSLGFQQKKVFKPVYVDTITPPGERDGEPGIADIFVKEVSISNKGFVVNTALRGCQVTVENPQDAVIFHSGFGVAARLLYAESFATATYVDPYDDPYSNW